MLEEIANAFGGLQPIFDDIVVQTQDFTDGWFGKKGPAHWAAGYLDELTGVDMEEYILDCYEEND